MKTKRKQADELQAGEIASAAEIASGLPSFGDDAKRIAAARRADELQSVVSGACSALENNPQLNAFARCFFYETVKMVETLNAMAEKHPQHFRHISKMQGLWPWFMRATGEIQDKDHAATFAVKLGLGDGVSYSVKSPVYKPAKNAKKQSPMAGALRAYFFDGGVLVSFAVEDYGDIPHGLKVPKGKIPAAILAKILRVVRVEERRMRSDLCRAHREGSKIIPPLKFCADSIPMYRRAFVDFITAAIKGEWKIIEYDFVECGTRYRGKRGDLRMERLVRDVESSLRAMCGAPRSPTH